MIELIRILILVHSVGALQFVDLDQTNSLAFIIETASSVFSLLLFFVTLYAWSRRGRQSTLLIVSLAFLVYFSKLLIEIIPVGELHDELIASIMDFVTLGLFFLALVIRPNRSRIAGN
ncbi:MAG: hypothetical protein JRN20_08955 [Nitrososphaerota archaeon]|nr:hypothetical protein [Nitrososphaerota archaeon]MDG6922119.1 hypothetical protein [Nitrososphaerota archaeon]